MTKAVERNLVRHGIERITGRARFLPAARWRSRRPAGERVVLEADVVLLASGSRPRHPPNIPMDDPDVHDSDEHPGDRARAGVDPRRRRRPGRVRVRVDLRRARRAGDDRRRHPPALGARRRDGRGCSPSASTPWGSASSRWSRYRASSAWAAASKPRSPTVARCRSQKVLVAAGRRPQIEGLGLAEVGVELDAAGWVRVDEPL